MGIDRDFKRAQFLELKRLNDNGELVIGKRPKFTKAQRQKVFEDYEGQCNECNCATGPRFEVDHIVRWSWGGQHVPANWQLLCIPCHTEKTGDEAPRHAKAVRNAKKVAGTTRPKPPIPSRPVGASRPFPKDNRRALRSRGFTPAKAPQ
jgi:hypothetical protein